MIGSTGLSPRPVLVLAIASTTAPALGVGDLAEDGVLAVEVRGRPDGDEELRAVGVRAGVRHREQVRPVEGQLRVELVGELVARPAVTLAQRVAALDHESGDDAVEHRAVVERVAGLGARGRVGPFLAARGQVGEVLHRLRGVVAEQLQADVAGGRVQGGDLRRGHEGGSWRGRGRSRVRTFHPATAAVRSALGRRSPGRCRARCARCRCAACARRRAAGPWRTRRPSRACRPGRRTGSGNRCR